MMSKNLAATPMATLAAEPYAPQPASISTTPTAVTLLCSSIQPRSVLGYHEVHLRMTSSIAETDSANETTQLLPNKGEELRQHRQQSCLAA